MHKYYCVHKRDSRFIVYKFLADSDKQAAHIVEEFNNILVYHMFTNNPETKYGNMDMFKSYIESELLNNWI